MFADLLRRAATSLRAKATAATGGTWCSLDGGDRLVAFNLAGQEFGYVVDEPMSNAANAAYIEMMHPAVAVAVAEWLDTTADRIDRMRPVLTRPPEYTPEAYDAHIARVYDKPIAVAREVLREVEGGDRPHPHADCEHYRGTGTSCREGEYTPRCVPACLPNDHRCPVEPEGSDLGSGEASTCWSCRRRIGRDRHGKLAGHNDPETGRRCAGAYTADVLSRAMTEGGETP
jgi:hypothetical protein